MTLLDHLADCETHSYPALTALLAISRAELNQQLTELDEQGLEIEKNEHTCRLKPALPLLDAFQLRAAFSPYQTFIFPTIDSTNQFIIDKQKNLQKGDICLTEYQTAGRGRRGRQWLTPFATQAVFSLYWEFDAKLSLNGVSLVVGIAIADALSELGATDLGLKWPNDLFIHGRKAAGILIELLPSEHKKQGIVVGVGINLALPKNNHIDQPWANLQDVLPDFDRNHVIIAVVQKIRAYLTQFEQQGLTPFLLRWQHWDIFFGEEIHILREKDRIRGRHQGIDQDGCLLLEHNGEILRFNGGEVSLRRF